MGDPNLATGSIWRLKHGDREVARLAVTGTDMPWIYARIELLPGFEPFRALFADQERAIDAEDWAWADLCYHEIRRQLTMTFPDANPVPEFVLHIHDDNTASWRWHHEPFTAPADH